MLSPSWRMIVWLGICQKKRAEDLPRLFFIFHDSVAVICSLKITDKTNASLFLAETRFVTFSSTAANILLQFLNQCFWRQHIFLMQLSNFDLLSKLYIFSVSLIVENYRLNACTGHFERNQSDFWLQKIFMWLKNRMFWRRNPMFWWDSLNIHVRLVTKVSPKWSNIAYETEKISFT